MAASGGGGSAGKPPVLTKADRENLRYLWAKMFEEAEETGRLIIIKFFTDHPESKQYFQNIPTEGVLQNNPLVAFHGRRVILALNQVFQHVDNWKQACKLLRRLVDVHKHVHRVPVDMFQAMFRSMLSICEDLLKNEFTDDMLASWEKLFGAIYGEISAAYSRQRLS